ncbi:hypothetical protein C8A01DRAFT_51014 [Parachaetomium inaequale]|uniref:DUF7357 domain-containing protein n=1 Tax=Parachaetomium inaequale TaxID=2588326 RepID=A0AAN6SLW5_9PEZI|nr:hypothetical protein C8A01DRAFT_51014 [Parachaetomium inaequale]
MRDTNSLRLRLVVRRHALPEVRVVFAVQLDTDPTIASLLEQVNNIIPLESNDWGLEDYAVELRDSSGHGFDCLHFQQVSVILKNDEEVFIRPLDTGDRRRRRLSGRDQITTDGKHLIDGVAFGRPLLKTPRNRPAVDIPPLKRRRITYEDEEGEHEEPRLLLTEHGEDERAGRRVRIRAGFDDAQGDGSDGDEEDGDDDFMDDETDEGEDNDFGGSDLEDELRDLQADNERSQDEGSKEAEALGETAQPSEPGRATRLDLETLDKISALRSAFPTVQFDACETALAQHGGNAESAYFRLRTQHQPLMSLDAMLADLNPPAPKAAATEDDAADESEAESLASMVKHYDQHGFPSGSILAGTAAAQMADAMRKSGHSVKPPVHTKFDDDDEVRAGQSPSRSSSDEEENASESGSESDNDSGPEVASSKMPKAPGGASLVDRVESPTSDDSDSESESEADNESDSSSEAETSDSDDSDGGTDLSNATSDGDGGNSDLDSDDSSVSSDESDLDSSSDHDSDDSMVEAAAKSLAASKEALRLATSMQSLAPQDTSVQGPQPESMRQGVKNRSAETQQPVPPGQGKSATQKRNARRRAARAAQNAAARGEQSDAGGLDVLPAQETQDFVESIAAKKAALLQSLGTFVRHAEGSTGDGKDDASTPPRAPAAVNSGLNTPDEPVDDGSKGASLQQQSEPRVGASPALQDDSEAWRDKISYRAVECCQDGIELSEPPFPFVQRWDPQQQYFHGDKNKRGGRSKRKQRNQEDFLDQGSRSSTKRRKHGGDSWGYDADHDNEESWGNHDDTSGFDETVLNYDEEEGQEQEEQTPAQNVDDDEDDLPPLPADVSTLPVLNSGEALKGMILTWKQWLLSRATNWQPQVSSLTGVVVDVFDDNSIEVHLAKRDRNFDRNEKVYDDDGNRVYDKFELPGMDDEGDDAAEQGYRTLDLADMIEPRILQPAAQAVGTTFLPKQPSDPKPAARDATQSDRPKSSDDRVSATPDEAGVERNGVDSQQMDIDTQCGGGQSMVSETPVAQEPFDTSISEDRRHEISQLMNDAGFRKDVDPSVTDITDNAGLDLSSPSQQLEEMAHDATILASEASEPQSRGSPKLPSQGTSNNDSQLIHLEPFHRFSDLTSDPSDEPRVALHSGRQVDPDFSIDLGNDLFPDVDDPVTTKGEGGGGRRDGCRGGRIRLLDPVFSEMWASRSTNGSKSPSKAAVMSAIEARKPGVAPDIEYEESMRRLDNSESDNISGDDDKGRLSKLAQKLVDKPIEKPTPKKSSQKKGTLKASAVPQIKAERASPSPAGAARSSSSRTACASGSPFAVPEGSQHYAEDDIDETYKEPAGSMPTGLGWVPKPRARPRDATPKKFTSSHMVLSALKRAKKLRTNMA